jgi:hypothetical protein
MTHKLATGCMHMPSTPMHHQTIDNWNANHSHAMRLLGYNTIQYNTIQYNTIQYNTIQYNTIQYNTIQYNTMQYNTIQYNAIQCNPMQSNPIQWQLGLLSLTCNAQHHNSMQCNWLLATSRLHHERVVDRQRESHGLDGMMGISQSVVGFP